MQAIDWLARRSLYDPDKVAVVEVSTGRQWTYRELDESANRVAHFLEGQGVRPGDRIALLVSNCAEVLALFFGVMKLGAIFVPLNYRLAPPELVPILLDFMPAVVIYSDEFRGVLEALCGQVDLPCRVKLDGALSPSDLFFSAEIERYPARLNKEIPVSFDAPLMLLYTSGSTGKPKGAILPHRMIFWNFVNFALRDLLPSDTVLVHTPMFYTGGLNVYTLPTLILGGKVVLLESWSADEALRTIERERVTVLFAVPTQFLVMADSPIFETANLSSLRYVISGGAPCPVPLMKRLIARGLRYKQGMGLTEVGPNCFALEARDASRKAGSIGFPNVSVQARIVDENGNEVGLDAVGELILKTPAMIDGYWNNPQATAAAIREGWFYTGDLARRDAEGFFYIVDRKKDMFISGGENVYPAEVEQVLLQHPKAADVAVVGVPHPKWGEVGCAAIVLRKGENATAEDFLAFCEGKIAKYKIPKSVVILPELPRTHSGKVKKHLLQRRIGTVAPQSHS